MKINICQDCLLSANISQYRKKNSSYFYKLYKPVLVDWQTLLTARAQESQKSLSFAIGH